jgi:hypothetical protein
VILTRPDLPLFERLNRAFVDAASTLDRSVIVQRSFIDEAKPQLAADRILITRADAVIVYGQELPSIIDAVTSITAGGKPVVTLFGLSGPCSAHRRIPRLAERAQSRSVGRLYPGGPRRARSVRALASRGAAWTRGRHRHLQHQRRQSRGE